MRTFGIFAGVSLAAIAASAGVLALAFGGDGDDRAVWWSAAVAYAVQLAGFVVALRFRRTNVMAGWGLAALLRLAALAAYGFTVVRVAGLPATAAMVSLAALLFVSTLVEPWVLAR